MLRTIALSLLMLITFGVTFPIVDSMAHGIRQSSLSHHSKYYHHGHSRTWWRRHRARLRRRRAAAMAHRNAPLAGARPTPPAVAAQLPPGWRSMNASGSTEMRFRTDTGNAAMPGQADLSVVALSRPNPGYLTIREQQRMLGGLSFSELRRMVIDKMVAAGGWVINDYQREVTGYRVFVVTAQTPSDGRSPEKSWSFYFTEINGRIYSLTTSTQVGSAERMEVEAERFIASLHPAPASGVQTNR